MKRAYPDSAPPPIRWRPWIWTIFALVLAWTILGSPGERRIDVSADLLAGRPDAALLVLAHAADELPPDAAGTPWWPEVARREALAELRARADNDLLEDLAAPTILSPLDAWLEPPVELRLREPTVRPLRADLLHLDSGLPVTSLPLSVGVDHAPLATSLLPGASYAISLVDDETGAVLALAGFRVLGGSDGQAASRRMTAAHDLGLPSHPGATLLSALAALHADLTDEALVRLADIQDEPGYERVALELRALVLARQGLDASARALLEGR